MNEKSINFTLISPENHVRLMPIASVFAHQIALIFQILYYSFDAYLEDFRELCYKDPFYKQLVKGATSISTRHIAPKHSGMKF